MANPIRPNPSTRFDFRLPQIIVGGWLLAIVAGHAQVSITMDPTKKLYVAYEPISVNVAITNRCGPGHCSRIGRTPWLSFSVTDSNGNLVAPSAATSL